MEVAATHNDAIELGRPQSVLRAGSRLWYRPLVGMQCRVSACSNNFRACLPPGDLSDGSKGACRRRLLALP